MSETTLGSIAVQKRFFGLNLFKNPVLFGYFASEKFQNKRYYYESVANKDNYCGLVSNRPGSIKNQFALSTSYSVFGFTIYVALRHHGDNYM